MARNASGTYTAPANSVNPAVEGTTIDEGDFNTLVDDIEAALTDSLDRTGKGKVTAHIDFDKNVNPGTPATNVGRLFGADDGGLTGLFWADSAGNTYNLLQGATSGLAYQFSTSTVTTSDPGNGFLRFNNASLVSVTEIAIDDLTTSGANVAAFIATWDDIGSADRGRIFVQKRTAPGTIAIFQVSGASTIASGWTRLAVTHVSSSGSFSASDAVAVLWTMPGPTGPTGAAGSVTSVAAGAGLSAGGVGSTGGSITGSGTLTSIEAVNAQTGTSYTIALSDHGGLVTLSNASSIAVTVPQATGSFGAGFYVDIANINAGVATLTPTTSTINGAASLILNQFLSVRLVSNGVNWIVLHGSSLRTQTTTVASASTTDIGATASQRISVTGTTTITSFGTVPNQLRFVTFAGALTLTHNATTLILPGGANITTAAGDAACFSSDASGNWRCLSYQKADGTAVVGGAGSSAPSEPQGRITLTTAVPVLTATVAAATTVFYAPYVGRFVPLYNGSTWTMTDIGGELSQTTTDDTKSPAACVPNSNYDLFVWNDGGTYRFTRGPAWTSDTARGTGAGTTELVRVLGMPVNANAITNGPAAQRGTYVGTIRTNGSSQVDFIVGGTAAGGTAAVIGIWNMYNRVSVNPMVRDSTSSWSYNSTTTRSLNNSAGNRISFVRGLNEDWVTAILSLPFSGGASGDYQPGIALDSTSTITQASYGSFGTSTGPAAIGYSALPGLGWHYLQAVERQTVTASAATGFGVLSSNQTEQFTAQLRA